MSLYIGLMSGTSMDGIDAALVDVQTNQLIGGLAYPYSVSTKMRLEDISQKQVMSIRQFFQLNHEVGVEFAKAAQELLSQEQINCADVQAIGSHGQTIAHDAMSNPSYTAQIGCAHTIAARLRLPVVSDFRTRDIINGGQGAPFAPLYHQVLFGKKSIPIAVVNVGGITNVSFITPEKSIIGYDVGPGNVLMDLWARSCLQQPFDKNGEWAATGRVLTNLFSRLKNDNYFRLPPPKSLGKEYYSESWLMRHLNDEAPEDIQATLLELTAWSIYDAIIKQQVVAKQLLVCGGGAHNKALLAKLVEYLPSINVMSMEQIGIDPDYVEAMMFAWLADKRIKEQPVDLCRITGASKPEILGAIYPV